MSEGFSVPDDVRASKGVGGVRSNHEDASYNEELRLGGPNQGLAEHLSTPEGRIADAQQRLAQTAQAAAGQAPPEFKPVETGTDMVYLQHNSPTSTHITNVDPSQPGAEYFVLGRAQYMLDGEPFLVIDRQVLNRSTAIQKLMRQPLKHPRTGKQAMRRRPYTETVKVVKQVELEEGDLGWEPNIRKFKEIEVEEEKEFFTEEPVTMFEEISAEEYQERFEYWREWSATMMADFEERMLRGSPAEGDRDEDRVVISENWDAIEGGVIHY